MDLCEGLCRPPRPLIKPQDWPLAVTGATSAQHRLVVEPQDWPLVVVAATSAQHPRCRWSNLRIGLSEKDATGKAFGLAPDPATRLGSTAAGGYLGFCPLGLGRGGLAWPWLWPWKCTCWEAPWIGRIALSRCWNWLTQELFLPLRNGLLKEKINPKPSTSYLGLGVRPKTCLKNRHKKKHCYKQ